MARGERTDEQPIAPTVRRTHLAAVPYIIGVTGNIATGKSTVLAMLRDLGAATIDADAVYHALIAPTEPLWLALRHRFGDAIVGPGGAIDRKVLGAVVFADKDALADLDALTHPAVVAEVRRLIADCAAPVVAVDAVKLIESGLDGDSDQVWLVTASRETQVERLMARNGLTRSEAEVRIDAQPPSSLKAARADLVIDNSGSVDDVRVQVVRAWNALGFGRDHWLRAIGNERTTERPGASQPGGDEKG